jgi:hypothetical protein
MLFSSPRWRAGAILALGFIFLSVAETRAQDASPEVKAARKDVVALTEKLVCGKAITRAEVAAFRKKHELFDVLMIYKPPAKDGLGTGKPGEGIEARIINLGRTQLTPLALKKDKGLLVRIGHINVAMAEITREYPPVRTNGVLTAREWKQRADELKKASLELIDAARKVDPARVKKAARDMHDACNGCHIDRRGAS